MPRLSMCTSQDMYLSALAAPRCFCLSKLSRDRQRGLWGHLQKTATVKEMKTDILGNSPFLLRKGLL